MAFSRLRLEQFRVWVCSRLLPMEGEQHSTQAGSSAAVGKLCCSRPTSPSYFTVLLNNS
jgi:hypothetical protein